MDKRNLSLWLMQGMLSGTQLANAGVPNQWNQSLLSPAGGLLQEQVTQQRFLECFHTCGCKVKFRCKLPVVPTLSRASGSWESF